MSALNAIWGLICIGMVIGAGGWLRMKMGKNRLCGICAMVMLRGVQSWHGAMNMGGSDGYGPCGSGTRAPGCQYELSMYEASILLMIMMRTMVTRMPIMGVMVRFYIVLHDFILISYDYHDH